MNWWQRAKNLYFLSSISREDVLSNPSHYMISHANKDEMGNGAYIAGLSEEESNFAATLNADFKDTPIK